MRYVCCRASTFIFAGESAYTSVYKLRSRHVASGCRMIYKKCFPHLAPSLVIHISLLHFRDIVCTHGKTQAEHSNCPRQERPKAEPNSKYRSYVIVQVNYMLISPQLGSQSATDYIDPGQEFRYSSPDMDDGARQTRSVEKRRRISKKLRRDKEFDHLDRRRCRN